MKDEGDKRYVAQIARGIGDGCMERGICLLARMSWIVPRMLDA